MKIIKSIRFNGFDLNIGLIGFGFTKYSFKNTSLTFLYDWTLRAGIIAITKHQTKSFKELKGVHDMEWNKKFEEWEKEDEDSQLCI